MPIAPRVRLARVEAKAATRERLLSAAADVFARRGYGEASMKEIADEAGHTTGALYAHFESKEDLFLALMDDRMSRQYDTFASLTARAVGPDVLEGLQAWFEGGPAADRGWGLLSAEFSLYARRHPDVLQKLLEHSRQARDALASVIEDAFDRAGLAPPRSPRDLAQLALAIGNGLLAAIHLDADVPADLFIYAMARTMIPAGPTP